MGMPHVSEMAGLSSAVPADMRCAVRLTIRRRLSHPVPQACPCSKPACLALPNQTKRATAPCAMSSD